MVKRYTLWNFFGQESHAKFLFHEKRTSEFKWPLPWTYPIDQILVFGNFFSTWFFYPLHPQKPQLALVNISCNSLQWAFFVNYNLPARLTSWISLPLFPWGSLRTHLTKRFYLQTERKWFKSETGFRVQGCTGSTCMNQRSRVLETTRLLQYVLTPAFITRLHCKEAKWASQ
jgi:hypothetical protein